MSRRPGFGWVSFTTDYGLDDGFAAACTGVIARIAPGVRVIDVSHTVPPQDVRRGATVLAQTVPYLPEAVHLAVVDPGVGTARRGLVLVAPDGMLVGPDNGLLIPAAEALGGVTAAYELTDPAYRLPALSATFHGRDVFAPAAAHLALGLAAEKLGPPVDRTTLHRLATPVTTCTAGRLRTEVLATDRFGNLQLAARAADLATAGLRPPARLTLHAAATTVELKLATTFGDVPPGAVVAFVDSAGHLAVAVNGGSAAGRLALGPGAGVELRATG
ncbi:SAM hydrolase/SAM-dependent halogenase family protein [Pseudonocardia bannensis]|uniref:SAM-dependent chlorinase/fluorinase n=1 Tax=Pseudonocardia bannensis TaxID=630973 RepID=A0A848DJ44_9PSEU|nr:SAM-dependent chlorinase/fluorinase [Pseudonocardia bannensis]NMH92556.1 SAM-dependent chlorinase/fluorinase [Pseudonocardia bannensis]